MIDPSAIEVPVALFVYRRCAPLHRTLDCLRASGAGRLYVFSDAAAGPEAQDDVAAVRALVAAIDWTDTIVVERPRNLGLSASIRDGLDSVFAAHESVMVIEDDVCVAPEFCRYAQAALDAYRDEPRVAGVTGLRYPFARDALERYPYDVFMSPRFSSWGWASWRDRWASFSFDGVALRNALAERGAELQAARAGADMPWLIENAIVRESLGGSWDVACAANMLLRDQWFVTPAWNMVENSGIVEGTHGSRRAPGWRLEWETERRPADLGSMRFPPAAEEPGVLRDYRAFFEPGLRQRAVAALSGLRRMRSR